MAHRDQGMRMLVKHEEDEEDDEDDEDDEDEDEEGEAEDEDENENEDDDPLPARKSPLGGRSGGTRAGLNLGLPGKGGSFRVSNGPGACLFLAKARATSASTASFRDKGGP